MTQRFLPLLFSVAFLHGHSAVAQQFSVPPGYEFRSQADYTRYEPDIQRCIDFLEEAPMNDSADVRQEANTFFLRWLSGTSRVSIRLQTYVMKLTGENKDLLMVYLGGWTKFALQHADTASEIECHLAAVRSVLKAYQHCAGVKHDNALEEILALEREGKLQGWVLEQTQKD
jgi:hypothetical protein